MRQLATIEKGRGRIESRIYAFYDVLELKKAEHGGNTVKSKRQSKVKRRREEIKSGKVSVEEAFYLSNEVGKYKELAEAIRFHWQVGVNNQIRDVSLKEDRRHSKKRSYST